MKKTLAVFLVSGVMIAVLVVLSLFTFENKEILYSIVSIFLFLAGSIFLKIFSPQEKFRRYFRFYPLRGHDIKITLWITLALISGGFLLNLLTMTLYEQIGIEVVSSLQKISGDSLVVSLLTVAVIPAIFEEIYFRGAVLSSLQEKGVVFAVGMSSLVFTLSHGLSGYYLTTFLAGCVFAILALVTNSVFTTMFAHFLYNIISYVLYVYSSKLTLIGLDSFVIFGMILVFLLGAYGTLSACAKIYREKAARDVAVINEGARVWEEKRREQKESRESSV